MAHRQADVQPRIADRPHCAPAVRVEQPTVLLCLPAVQVPEKVSATPVNNRFRDLQNQLALAYEGNDDD